MIDYYSILGVAKDATPGDIKKAYRKAASVNHPDKGGDTKKFQEVQVAYDTLSDSNKRAEYDMMQAGGGHNRGGFRFHTNSSSWGDEGGLGDIFDMLRRQFNQNPGFSHQQQQPMNRDARINMRLKLADTLEEQEKIIKLNLPKNDQEEIKIKIPRGVYHGAQIRYPGLGDHSVPNAPRADLYVQFFVEPDPNFEQVGIDLLTELRINCLEAIVGCEKEITGLDGKKFNIVVPPGSQVGSKFGLGGQGLYTPDNPGRGRLIVVLNIEIPTALTDEQLEAIRNIQQALNS